MTTRMATLSVHLEQVWYDLTAWVGETLLDNIGEASAENQSK